MATEELGAAAYRKFDIEAWIPSKGDYGEISSASNCTSYQSRRLNIQYMDKGNEKKLAHTINGTALAVPRVLLTLLELNYDAESDSIKMPEALLPFLPFSEISEKRQSLILT
jgi:seryl-tRNA synthetase